MAITATKRRTNGFQDPLHPYQVTTWILGPICYIIAVIEVLYLYPLGFQVPYIIFLSIFTVLSIIFVIYTTAYNPEFKESYVSPTDLERSCYICKMQIDQSTRHCTKCNKCVYGFDHHCIWLNNCVGKKNYSPFIIALFSATLMVFFELVVGIVTFILYFAQKKKFEDNLSDLFGCKKYNDEENMCKTAKLPGYGLIIIDAFYVVLLIILFYYLIDLVIFHIKLMHRGITTYQYIVKQQQQQQQQQQQKLQPQPQPTSLEEPTIIPPPTLDNNNMKTGEGGGIGEIQLTVITNDNNATANNNNNNRYKSPPPKLHQQHESGSYSSSSSFSSNNSPMPLQKVTPTQPPLHPQTTDQSEKQKELSEEAYKPKEFTVTKMSNDGNARTTRPSNVEIDFENRNNGNENSISSSGGGDVVAHVITVASKETAIPENSDSDK